MKVTNVHLITPMGVRGFDKVKEIVKAEKGYLEFVDKRGDRYKTNSLYIVFEEEEQSIQ